MRLLRLLNFKTLEKAAGLLVLAAFAFTIQGSFGSVSNDCGEAASSGAAVQADNQIVKVLTRREGNVTRFFVENNEYCEVTMTFDVASKNLKSQREGQFPRTMVFPPRQQTEAFALEPIDPAQGWEFSYTNYYKLGSSLARHDDTFLYGLPYASGARFKVTQAFGGSFSHKGSNKYAIDWKMPEGTPVHAARGGEVVKIKQDSTRGGPSMNYDKYNNFVLIRHDDGTLGHYCHLLKESVVVKVGQRVSAGQRLASSGNTGFSSGPHLHFCVFKTIDGKDRESVAVKFRTEGEKGTTLLAGRNYESVPSGAERSIADTRSARTVNTAAGASGS